MEVYLVPVGRGRHALYCEPGEESSPAEASSHRGVWKRLADQFSAVIAAVEREQDEHLRGRAAGDAVPAGPSGLWSRLRTRALAWVAEKVAEQRLLWHLRGKVRVRAWIPGNLGPDRGLTIIRGTLTAEFDRHRWWLVVDSLGGLLSAALMFLPGPNVIGYYFAFRIVGHFLSLRGARHGLTEVRWDIEPSATLAGLTGLEDLPTSERELRVQSVADELGLRRFPQFYRRTAVGTA